MRKNIKEYYNLNLKKVILAYLVFFIFMFFWGIHFGGWEVGLTIGAILTIPSLIFIVIYFTFFRRERNYNNIRKFKKYLEKSNEEVLKLCLAGFIILFVESIVFFILKIYDGALYCLSGDVLIILLFIILRCK